MDGRAANLFIFFFTVCIKPNTFDPKPCSYMTIRITEFHGKTFELKGGMGGGWVGGWPLGVEAVGGRALKWQEMHWHYGGHCRKILTSSVDVPWHRTQQGHNVVPRDQFFPTSASTSLHRDFPNYSEKKPTLDFILCLATPLHFLTLSCLSARC